MNQRGIQLFHIYIRGIILISFGLLFLKLIITGHMENFIAPKMVKFIYFTLVAVILLGLVQLWRGRGKEKFGCGCCNHSLPRTKIGSLLLYLLFCIPLITAFLFSNYTIDESVAKKRGLSLTGEQLKQTTKENVEKEQSGSTKTQPLTDGETQSPGEYYDELEKKIKNMDIIHVDDDNYMPIMQLILVDVEGFKGKNITITGFIHREKEFNRNEVFIARYGITCCVADATVWGMLATGKGVSSLKNGEWVTVTGVLDTISEKGISSPVIKITTIKKITTPKTPYVYQKL
ncbi:TPA: TIGR03943 family protein [Bacillus thuringiensis]|nr:TIGR03943 family protein [Bacillus thuringiensis]